MRKRKVDSNLWRQIQEYSKGDIKNKIKSIEIIFKQHYQLPEEYIDVANELASKDQPKEVRLAIAKYLAQEKKIPLKMHTSLISVLTKDPDEEVMKIMVYDVLKSDLESFFKNLNTFPNIMFKNLESIDFTVSPMLKNLEIITKDNLLFKNLESINFAISPMLKNLEIITKDNLLFKNLESINFAISPMLKNLEAFNIASNFPALKNLESLALPQIIPSKQLVNITGISEILNRAFSKDLLKNMISYYEPSELEVVEKSIEEPKKEKILELMKRLQNCKEDWREYEDICKDILSYCLVPPLMDPMEQAETRNGLHRRDLIFHIPHGLSGFWNYILTVYGMAIIVECKNYSDKLKENEVFITSKYFHPKKLTSFGLILTRFGLHEHGIIAQENAWREDQKMIICLIDDDLIKMLKLKDKGDEPWKVIDNALRDFRQSL